MRSIGFMPSASPMATPCICRSTSRVPPGTRVTACPHNASPPLPQAARIAVAGFGDRVHRLRLGKRDEPRQGIAVVIEDSPSLRAYPSEILDRCYAAARSRAVLGTRLPENDFPEDCPFPLEMVLDSAWLPGSRRVTS